MSPKKLYSGAGWSFEPAGGDKRPEIVSLPPEKQKAKLSLEKRKKGKEVTVVAGFVLSAADRAVLAAKLKKLCGAGGSDTDADIEIQGDQREKARSALTELGWTVKG